MAIKMKEMPVSERPYEKLELQGEKTLSNAELLAIIIKTGTKNESSVDLACKILKLNQSTKEDDLSYLKNISIEEFMQIKGIGKVKAIQLKAICELAVRMNKPTNYKNIQIKSPEDMAKVVMNELKNETKEIVKLVMLDNRNQIVKMSDIATGGSNFANFSVSEILGETLKTKAPKIILIHNHPSGNSEPSQRDIEITSSLYNACQIVGIELIDHIVIGNAEYTSIMSKIANELGKNNT
ncbi:MAG: DNA repair protein RadC [Clostridia bacterium]|nr:DNA repair protein RadC [Clostridia bacterium]